MSFVSRVAFAALNKPRSSSEQYVQYSGIASPLERRPFRCSRSRGRKSFTRSRAAKSERRPPREFAAFDASAHLPDLGHADEIPVLDEREEPSFAIAARDLRP